MGLFIKRLLNSLQMINFYIYESKEDNYQSFPPIGLITPFYLRTPRSISLCEMFTSLTKPEFVQSCDIGRVLN